MREGWTHVIIPIAVKERLDRVARELEVAHQKGRSKLPNNHCEHVPIHYMITKAFDEYERHLERARRQTARPSRRQRLVPPGQSVLIPSAPVKQTTK